MEVNNKKTKFIFVTGGVCSSLGKGIAIASLGLLLEGHGYKISIIKMDPYINIDPGTMSPFQHGEVYVTEDGAETDLDLGYYERFTNANLSKKNSVSTGQIYYSVIQRERRGDYLGRTVQVIPHITNEIKKRIFDVANEEDIDFVMVEIGGTVGDIESIPFLEAIRQVRQELGSKKVLNVHLTLVPTISVAGEQKTKPTQHSVKELMQLGIIPDILLCRTGKRLSDEMRSKIALFCNVKERNVISAEDIHGSIYEIPAMFHKNCYDEIVLEHFGLPVSKLTLPEWNKFIKSLTNPRATVTIAVVGKYISLQDSYRSIYEALLHGAVANHAALEIVRIDSEDIEDEKRGNLKKLFKGVDGLLVPGGFGDRGIEGKIMAISHARKEKIPFFGICLGMQCAVIEFGRNVCGLKGANSSEFDPGTPYPVISLLEDQEIIIEKGGTMRLGGYLCKFTENSIIRKIYNKASEVERHRHRFEFTIRFKSLYEERGMVFGGIHPKNSLVETIEIADHPWFIATQFHPEFKSKPVKPHPLFKDFIAASLKNSSRGDK
ncbi:MAG TPA: CTP synthase [Spirochaetota bacterium]|nr:CTP synthase [Spirochaetota bacterium]HPI90680.1 CTP synthase [Spirochaetota bacterium]HPR49167.1 CTP synthase [Spirochaetota bacterium]